MPDTFQTRLKDLLGPRGYEDAMRRSVQSVILYEAFRCVESKLGSLRPFQRKLAFFDQAVALLESLDFISPHQRETILWRTNTSREVLEADVAWKRQKLIDKELAKFAERMEKGNLMAGRTHNEACDALVEELFRSSLVSPENEAEAAKISKEMPKNWEHSHSNTIMCYRLYYNGAERDPSFPPPIPATEIVVPAEKPKPLGKVDPSHYISLPGGGQPGSSEDAIDLRRKRLSEIREHMETLDRFHGIVDDEDINERKRELFQALPPIPPYANKGAAANNNKKLKK